MKYKVGDRVTVKSEFGSGTATITKICGEADTYPYKVKKEGGGRFWLRENEILGVVKDAEVEFPNLYEDSKAVLSLKVWLTSTTSETFMVEESLWSDLLNKGYTGSAMYGALCYALNRLPKSHDAHISISPREVKRVKVEVSKMVWEYSGRGDTPVQTIKFIRQCYGIGLKEAKDLWDSVQAQES